MSKKGIFFFSPLTTMHCGLPNVVIYKEIANARRHFLPRNANYIRESGEKFIHIRVPTCVISSLYVDLHVLFFLFFQEDSPSCDIFEKRKKICRRVPIQIRILRLDYSRETRSVKSLPGLFRF